MQISLVPSYPAPNKEALTSVLTTLEGVSAGFQVDIVDGQFVPAVSWPFSAQAGVADLEELSQFAEKYELEIDCMVLHPEQYLDLFISVGFKRVVIHYGSTDNLDQIIARLRENNIKVGIAATNDISLDELLPVIEKVDYVQIMGIKEVGKQGQPFDDRTYETVKKLREHRPEIEIAVDGGVNQETIPKLFAAGANRFAPGSAITKAADPIAAYKQLVALVVK